MRVVAHRVMRLQRHDQRQKIFIAAELHFGPLVIINSAKLRTGVNKTMFQRRGEVVTIGTTDWVFGLAEDAAVQQVTRNILDRPTRA